MSLTLENLLAKGYLPQELPPTFSSQKFAKFVAAAKTSAFPFIQGGQPSVPEVFNLARTGTLRRQLAILNPIHYSFLADFVVEHWTALEAATGSQYSLSTPVTTDARRGIGRKNKMDQRPERRAQVYAEGRHLLRADISRFYPSIYTHSIPWALHGKEFSKKNKKAKNLGNKLDWLVGNCQYGQTNGIPIGPDTSLLIAEILLSKVDEELKKHNFSGMRYVDDYELVFNSEANALEGLSVLQESLLGFELHLNPAKTHVLGLPQRVDESWVSTIRGFLLEPSSPNFKSQVIQFFDTAFDLSQTFPDTGVLKYAAGRIANIRTWKSHYDLVEDLLIQAARVEAGSLPAVLNTILRNSQLNSARNERRRNLFLRTIVEHAPQRHSSEVAWSIWACIAQSFPISKEALELIVKMEDSICALAALHARTLGLAEEPSALDSLAVALTTEELYDSRWMLAYEAHVRGWLVSPSGTDFVTNDTNFAQIKAAGVNFYDTTKTGLPPIVPSISKIISDFEKKLLEDSGSEEGEDYESFEY
jgi:hypothetical protein